MLAVGQRPALSEATRLDRVLREALARHESALGRLRYELPNPTEAALAELEAAERHLRASQAQRDALAGRR